MGRSVTVTVTLEVQLDVPTYFEEEDVLDKLEGYLSFEAKSSHPQIGVLNTRYEDTALDEFVEDE